MRRKLRVLALHSFRTSGCIFRQQFQLSGLDTALEDLLEIVFIDAPNAASGDVPADVATAFPPPYWEWWNAERDAGSGKWLYGGAHASVAHLAEYLRSHGPFDGLIGFSQGGAMAAIAVAGQLHGELLQGLPPLRFCVIFAGIKSRDQRFAKSMEQPIKCPALHVIGDRDYVKRPAYELLSAFEGAELITHPRGHVIPRLQGQELASMRSFLERFAAPQPSL